MKPNDGFVDSEITVPVRIYFEIQKYEPPTQTYPGCPADIIIEDVHAIDKLGGEIITTIEWEKLNNQMFKEIVREEIEDE